MLWQLGSYNCYGIDFKKLTCKPFGLRTVFMKWVNSWENKDLNLALFKYKNKRDESLDVAWK